MLAVLFITVLFILISIYFFFRAEKLQRDLLVLKREIKETQKEHKFLSQSMAIISSQHEEFAKIRFSQLTTKSTSHDLNIIKPFIDNYNVIFRECLKGKNKMQASTKKCYAVQNEQLFSEFTHDIINKDKKFQRLWRSNNLVGFISLVEAILIKYEEQETLPKQTEPA